MHWQGIGFSGISNTLVDVFNTEFNIQLLYITFAKQVYQELRCYTFFFSNSPLFGLFLVIGFIIIKQEINENGNYFLSVTFVNGWN